MPKIVLVCDDEPYILEAVGQVVREEGYALLTAEDGEQALAVARVAKPQLLLLDVLMPKKTGFEVCRELKADPSTQGIYIVLLTAMGQERDMHTGFECGAQEYITKPFSPRKLRRRLHELLDGE